jgi:pyrroloquinoline quinone biosynthesis protein E
MALTGDAKNTDPACSISPLHNEIFDMAAEEARNAPPEFIYRKYNVRFNSPI